MHGGSRRSPEEVHRLILDAARDLFATRGYAGTSMRDVAERAGVYGPMIYRRVGSKAHLFESAVLEPFTEVVRAHVERATAWGQSVPVRDIALSWIPPTFAEMREHRELLLALLAAEGFHGDEFGSGRPLSEVFRRMVADLRPEAQLEVDRRPLPGVDVPANIVVNIGMILGVALLEDMVRADGEEAISTERLVEEMLAFAEYGIYRPDPDGEQPEPARRISERELAGLLDRLADAERRAIRAELELELREHTLPRTERHRDPRVDGR